MHHEIEYDWTFVDKETSAKARVLIALLILVLLLIVPAALLVAVPQPSRQTDNQARHYYASNAVTAAAREEAPEDEDNVQANDESTNQVQTEAVIESPPVEDLIESTDLHESTQVIQDSVVANHLAGPSADAASQAPEQDPSAPTTDEFVEQTDSTETADKGELEARLQSALASENSDDDSAPAGAQEIEAGVNAPHYVFASVDDCIRLAADYGAEFIVWDGSYALRIGRSLDSHAISFEILDENWHHRFSSRMATLPTGHPLVQSIIGEAKDRYPQLASCRVKLSLPHALDREILSVQRSWFERRDREMDVHAVTRLEVSQTGRFRIVAMIEAP